MAVEISMAAMNIDQNYGNTIAMSFARTVNACSDGCSIQSNAAVGFSIDLMFNHVHFCARVPIFSYKSISVSMTINGIIRVAIHYLFTFDLLFHQIKT